MILSTMTKKFFSTVGLHIKKDKDHKNVCT